MSQFDIRDAGDYIAPKGLYEQNKARPFLGSVACSHTQLTAGAWEEIQLVYTVGASGLADGAWLKLAFKFYSDWALFQTSDPSAANYVSAEYQAGPLVPGQSPATVQHLKVRFDQKGHERPFQKAILIDIIDGYINPGDKIIIRLCGEVIIYAWMDRRRENSEKPYGTRLGAGQAVSARLVGK